MTRRVSTRRRKRRFFVDAVVSSISHARPVAFVVCGPNHASYASTLPPSRDQKVSPAPETLQSSKSSKPSHTPKKLQVIGDQDNMEFYMELYIGKVSVPTVTTSFANEVMYLGVHG